MPRKPLLKKEKVNVLIDGKTVVVTLHPPTQSRKSWYAYWNGLATSKSTGHKDFERAVESVQKMLSSKANRHGDINDVLTDAEFEEIQRRHFAKRRDPDAQRRAEKSLIACLEAISAFREIAELPSIVAASPDDCESFQNKALDKPKNWRSEYPKKRKDAKKLSPNTVVKWSVALQAAFERANRNGGKKCVRGVVPESKLLRENPWRMFTWIEGRDPVIRQFDESQLCVMLDFFEEKWPLLIVAQAVAKTFLWSYARRIEVASLRWDNLRLIGNEVHFEIVGKWGVRKWFRVPSSLYHDMVRIRTGSDHVFASFNDQLRQHHESGPRPHLARLVLADFDPENLGDWFYREIVDWSKSFPEGSASVHMFRKTSLQYARSGEDVNRLVATDARVTTGVMMTNYVRESDEEMRQKSNRTFARIAASLSHDAARRFGHDAPGADPLTDQIRLAVIAENWEIVQRLSVELSQRKHASNGHVEPQLGPASLAGRSQTGSSDL